MNRTIKQGELRMTLPTNDDFANRELSIEELEAIAAGGLWGWIKHEVSAAVHWVESHVPHVPVPRYPIPPYL
jgi:hypothetical protein